MRLLLAAFCFDPADAVLSWQHRVATALAARCAHVTVLAERIAASAPRPGNLDLVEAPQLLMRAPGRWFGSRRLLTGWAERHLRGRYFDAGFVHMAHEWSPRLAPLLHRQGAPLAMWYAHGTVNPSLRRAVAACDAVVTSTPEGCRVEDPKVRVIGQGIDLGLYAIADDGPRNEVVYTGRIAPRKRLDLVLAAFAAAAARPAGEGLRLRLVGPCLSAEDRRCAAGLRERAAALGLAARVSIEGPVPPAGISGIHASAVLHLNCSATGSMDKTVLEALACGVPVLTTNPAFRALLDAEAPGMAAASDQPDELATGILGWCGRTVDRASLRAIVERNHGLDRWADTVTGILQDLHPTSP